ncbi:MAG: glycosyltransferase [Thermoplasmata archaeon]
MTGISLVVPAYNEDDRIAPTLESYLRVLEGTGRQFEVIVIVDGTDRTATVAGRFALRGVVVREYGKKLGRGGAIFEGFRHSRYEIVGFADADGSVPADDFRKMLEEVMHGSTAVIASRRLNPGVVLIPEPVSRRAVGWVWHALVKAFLSVPVHDAQCGLKLFSADVARLILQRVTVTNRAFEVGMLYHVHETGAVITELPVAYTHDFRTRMPIGRAIPVMFVTLIGIFLMNRTPVKRILGSAMFERFNRRFASI